MADLVLTPIQTTFNLTPINTNFDKIENKLNKDVMQVRGGNNTLYQELDMNSNKIINVSVDINDPSSIATISQINQLNASLLTEAGSRLAGDVAQKNYTDTLVGVANTSIATEVNARTSGDLINKTYAEQLVAGVSPGSGTGAFLQSGAGAVIRTFQDKERDVVSVKDFGANGDGMVIQGNSCKNNKQYGIYLQTGAYGVLTGNSCGDDQTTHTQLYGIRGPNGTTVRNNDVIGNVTAGIYNGIAAYNTGTYDAGLNRTA